MALRLPARVPIRVRTAAALSIPLALLMIVAGVEVAQGGREVADVREQRELATASIGPAGAINALMTERNYTSLWLFGVDGSVDLHVDSLDEARDRTDASLDAFVREVRRRGGRAERIYGPAIEALDVLEENRAAVDAYDGERNVTVENESGDRVWARYNRLVSKLAHANSLLAHEVEDEQLRQGVMLVDRASRQVDHISKLVRVATIRSIRAGGPITDRTDFGRIVRMMTEGDRHHLAILRLATGPYAHLAEPLRDESQATGIFEVQRRFAESGEVDVAALLRAVSIAEDESYYGFIHDVSDIIRDRADHLAAAARADQRRTVILSALLLVAAAGAAVVVARSITGPLRSLTREARDVAERRLPAAVRQVHELPLGQDVVVPALVPVAVDSRDEVADVADQLNSAQTAALDLAVEQAVLRRNFADVFVNLCRRIQTLLGRQLDVIAEVTAGTETPDRPGDVGPGLRRTRRAPDLGEVTRYAIRLRRHAESLLVLAGVEARPAPGEPAPLGDVVRAALDELSGSERVRLVGVEPVMLAGPAVADLTHLLAELVEGALRDIFPEETIEIAGVAGDDGYTLRIVDPGSGMAEDEIERANRRLAGDEAVTTAPSKYLGQYVAARLAARHGITVVFSGTMAAGVTAAVHLPSELLDEVPPEAPSDEATAHAGDEAEDDVDAQDEIDAEDDVDAEAAALAATVGNDPHPSGPNQVVPSDDDDVDVYRLLSDFTGGVERPALATPSARRPAGAPDDDPVDD